jgi:hypothetical protein
MTILLPLGLIVAILKSVPPCYWIGRALGRAA